MKYVSTRDTSRKLYTFEDALLSGYAPDGGLFVPEHLPTVTSSVMKQWSSLSYVELAEQVLRLFISTEEIPKDDLNRLCHQAFNGFILPSSSSSSSSDNDKVPIEKVGSIYVAELFHGPTFCFKDLGMQMVVHMLHHFAVQKQQPVTLLVSTTGDTGPAAVQAVRDVNQYDKEKKNTNSSSLSLPPLLSILVHYPEGQISEFQRRQMTSLQGPGIKVVAYQGGGDDMDIPLKRIQTSSSENKNQTKHRHLCGVNSYNIGRPLMQMVHYIWTYLRVVNDLNVEPGDPNVTVDIVLPTGAMGNIAGGYMAKCMGVPLGQLCSGVNINDVTCRIIETGRVDQPKEPILRTLSEAINVQLPYNLERLLFYLTNQNPDLVCQLYKQLQEEEYMIIPLEYHQRMQSEFRSARVTDDELCTTLKFLVTEHQYFADPHTGVAFNAAQQLDYFSKSSHPTTNKNSSVVKKPVALLATASPCKFQDAVTKALGEELWKKFWDTECPLRAREIMDRKDYPPFIVYKKEESISLEETQKDWEKQARSLIETL